jgi:hypothetical protein
VLAHPPQAGGGDAGLIRDALVELGAIKQTADFVSGGTQIGVIGTRSRALLLPITSRGRAMAVHALRVQETKARWKCLAK